MDLQKIQFVRKQDIHRRMSQFTPPEGESYTFRRQEDSSFSQCGISFSYQLDENDKNCVYPLFRIYTGTRDVYFHILDMIHEVAEEVGRPVDYDEWPASETTD